MWKNILAIIAFIILLLVGIWSAIQVISYIPHLFSKDSSSPTKDIVLTLSPESARAEDDVILTWEREGNNTGVVSFSYACTEGFHFSTNGTAIPCNAPFTMAPTITTLTITPHTTLTSVDVPLALTYTNDENVSVRDTRTLHVVGAEPVATTEEAPIVPATPGPVEPTPSHTPAYVAPTQQTVRIPRASNPYGVTDLNLQNIRTGVVNAYGNFVEQSPVSRYDKGAAVFTVSNNGTKETGIWYFSANVPSQGGYTFNSQPQPTLLPGATAEILITFDQLYPGSRSVVVTLDPYNAIPESNEYNNVLSRTMTILSF